MPRGHVVLEEEDLIVLGGEQHFDWTGHDLTEFTIPKGHKWANRLVKDLFLPESSLIVMVQRTGSGVIVPLGETRLLENDKVILLKVEEKKPGKGKP